MGLGDFISGVGDAVTNVGKAVGYVTAPTHWDDIAKGVGKAADFAVEHPGQAWDTAFEVGRAVVKDQMDPVNLAINAGLIAATVATSGAAAPALAAKLGLGTKSAEVGISALKGADTAIDVAKGAKTAAKAVDTAGDVSRAGRFVQDLKQIGTGIKESTGLQKLGQGLDAGLEVKGAAREAIGLSRYGGMTARRAEWGQRALEAGEDSGKFGTGLSKLAAKKLAGPANPLADPGTYNKLDRARHRYNQTKNVMTADEQVKGVGRAVDIAADPEAYAKEKAFEEMQRRGIGQSSGYVDRGQTAESPNYPDSEQTDMTGRRGNGPPLGGDFNSSPLPGDGGSQPVQKKSGSRTANRSSGTLKGRQHFWEGPGRQWAGGVSSSYDWRTVEPLRPIVAANKSKKNKSKSGGGGNLNEQGAPVNFSPEVPDSGMFGMSSGQQPEGSVFPEMIEPGKSRMYLEDVKPMPLGTIGIGQATPKNSGAIEAYASSEADYGMDDTGQGFLAFPESSQKALGPQPNTTTYAAGTRAQRRRMGQSTTGANPAKLGGTLF